MPARPDLAALLADPGRLADVDAKELPGLLAALAAEQARLAALEGAVAARLAAPMRNGNGTSADRLLTAEEVHDRTTLSVAWLSRHAGALPFTRRAGRKVLCSQAGPANAL